MPDSEQHARGSMRFVKIAGIAVVASMLLMAIAVAASVAMIVAAAGQASRTGQWGQMVFYAILLLSLPVAATWVLVVYGLVRTICANEEAVSHSAARLNRIETLLDDTAHSLGRLINLESLSDKAKSLIYRDRELEAMQEVIHDDILHQDYQTAEALIQKMDQQFGYADQAARLREELAGAREATLEEKIDAAVNRVRQIIEAKNWPRAKRAAEKLASQFPQYAQASGLPEMVEQERAGHKKQLLQEYGEVVRKNDVNRSIELLKELDLYLTPQEAAALSESARGVFRAKLHNLGVQFAICVTDGRWSEAIATGQEIVTEFPNSRMSLEVREKMPQLRDRLAEAEQAQAQTLQ